MMELLKCLHFFKQAHCIAHPIASIYLSKLNIDTALQIDVFTAIHCVTSVGEDMSNPAEQAQVTLISNTMHA